MLADAKPVTKQSRFGLYFYAIVCRIRGFERRFSMIIEPNFDRRIGRSLSHVPLFFSANAAWDKNGES